MDGLECSIINLKDVELDNEKYRFDSEFFKKEYLYSYRKIKKIQHSTISNEMKLLTDFHSNGSYKTIAENFKMYDEPNFAYMVRTTDLEIDNYDLNVKYIDEKAYNFLAKSKVQGGELLINKIGSPGRTFLMPKLNRPVSLGMNLFMVSIKEGRNTNEEILYLFLNSCFGKRIIERKINGTVPLTIDKEAIKSLYVPIFTNQFNQQLCTIVDESNHKLKMSKVKYIESEAILNYYLKIDFDKLNNSGISLKMLKDSYLRTSRIDAEYYQVKYDELLKIISKMDSDKLSNVCSVYKKNFLPKDDIMYKYIELADVDNNGNIGEIEDVLGAELPTRARRKVEKNQVIISSIEGSLQSCAMILSDKDNMLCSNGFYVIDSSLINSETLLLLFKNPVIQWQLKRGCVGTILTAIPNDEFCDIKVPIIAKETQKIIKERISESFKLRKESEELIKKGIKAVEIAIEKSEDEAIKYLESGS